MVNQIVAIFVFHLNESIGKIDIVDLFMTNLNENVGNEWMDSLIFPLLSPPKNRQNIYSTYNVLNQLWTMTSDRFHRLKDVHLSMMDYLSAIV